MHLIHSCFSGNKTGPCPSRTKHDVLREKTHTILEFRETDLRLFWAFYIEESLSFDRINMVLHIEYNSP